MSADRFELHIILGNDAMQSHVHVAAALREVAGRVAEGVEMGVIRDVNGNSVGAWAYTTKEVWER